MGPSDCADSSSGTWDATALLLEAGEAIDQTAAALPYIKGFAT